MIVLHLSGYLGLEALDEDSQLYQLCLYCGIIPEAVLGKWCVSLCDPRFFSLFKTRFPHDLQ